MDKYYNKAVEKYGLAKTGVKFKKNADCFDYFFSLDDAVEKYRDFLNPEVEPVKLLVETQMHEKSLSMKPKEPAREISILKMIPFDPADRLKAATLPAIQVLLPSSVEELEALPPPKWNGSPVPSLGVISQPDFSLNVMVEKPREEEVAKQPSET